MILLIDIGNSRTKYVTLLAGELSAITQVSNDDFNTKYFENKFGKVSEVILANVSKSSLTSDVVAWCDEQKVLFKQVKSEATKASVTSAYQEPSSLGIDRWLALLGGAQLFPNKNVLIIDAGTATTVDLLDKKGQHQGGWILAGIDALFNSILSHSTLVHADHKTSASLAFGRNTTDNVNNACWAATLGMIQQAIYQAKQLSNIDQIIITGGNGVTLSGLLSEQFYKEQNQDNYQNHNQSNHAISHVNNHSINKSEKSIDAKPQETGMIEYIDNLIFYGLQTYI